MSNHQSSTPTPVPATAAGFAAATDWFGLACSLLAPGTRARQVFAHAISWDAYDRLEANGFTPVFLKDEDGLHESMRRDLPDGEAVVFPPHTDRPVDRVCLHCDGRAWLTAQDEDGEWHKVGCEWCDRRGRVPRPHAPLPFGLSLEDFFQGGPVPGPLDAGF